MTQIFIFIFIVYAFIYVSMYICSENSVGKQAAVGLEENIHNLLLTTTTNI